MGMRMYARLETDEEHEIESPKLYGYVYMGILQSWEYLKSLNKYEEFTYGDDYWSWTTGTTDILLTESEFKEFVTLYVVDLIVHGYTEWDQYYNEMDKLVQTPGNKIIYWA